MWCGTLWTDMLTLFWVMTFSIRVSRSCVEGHLGCHDFIEHDYGVERTCGDGLCLLSRHAHTYLDHDLQPQSCGSSVEGLLVIMNPLIKMMMECEHVVEDWHLNCNLLQLQPATASNSYNRQKFLHTTVSNKTSGTYRFGLRDCLQHSVKTLSNPYQDRS